MRGWVIHCLNSTKWWLEITYLLFQFPYSTQYLPNFGSANLKLLNSIAIAHRLTCMQQIRNAKRTKGIYEILSLIYNVSVWAELNLLLCFCLVYKLEGVKLTCWLDYSFEIEALSIWFWTYKVCTWACYCNFFQKWKNIYKWWSVLNLWFSLQKYFLQNVWDQTKWTGLMNPKA